MLRAKSSRLFGPWMLSRLVEAREYETFLLRAKSTRLFSSRAGFELAVACSKYASGGHQNRVQSALGSAETLFRHLSKRKCVFLDYELKPYFLKKFGLAGFEPPGCTGGMFKLESTRLFCFGQRVRDLSAPGLDLSLGLPAQIGFRRPSKSYPKCP